MHALLIGVGHALLRILLGPAAIKFMLYSAIILLIVPLYALLISLLEENGYFGMDALVDQLPSDILFYFGVFKIGVGMKIILGAMLVKFFIRRLPVVG